MLEQNRDLTGPKVLDGIKVLDFTCVISGPYCTRMMADLGADVIKIEQPGGELLRAAPPMRNGASTLFAQLNAGKRCVELDLKDPGAVKLIKRLVRDVDVVVENFSPGVMKRLGLDYDTLKSENNDLVMCSISGFGQTGPDAQRPAFAPVVQAWSGYDNVLLRYQPGIDKPLNMGMPVADNVAGLQAFGAITAALFYRERTGIGQYIDIAMFDALLATMQKDFQVTLAPDTLDRLYGPMATADGYVMVMVIAQRHFEALATIIERPEIVDDVRFSDTTARLEHYDILLEMTAEWTARHSTAVVIEAFANGKIPASSYRDIGEALDDPQLAHRNMITEVSDREGPIKMPNSPFLFSATHATMGPWVANVGEHNDEVLGSALQEMAPTS